MKILLMLACFVGGSVSALASFSYTNNTGAPVTVTFRYHSISSSIINRVETLRTDEKVTITTNSEANYGNNPAPQVTFNTYWWSDADSELTTEDSGPIEMSECVAPGETISYEDSYSSGGVPLNTSSTLEWSDSEEQTEWNYFPFLEWITQKWEWAYKLVSNETTTPLGESTTYELVSVQ